MLHIDCVWDPHVNQDLYISHTSSHRKLSNVYGSTYLLLQPEICENLGSTSPLFSTFYTSPASISITKYHLLYKQTSDQFSLVHL